MKFGEFIISLFKDERGQISMKPVIAILGTIAIITSLIIDVLSKVNLSISEAIIYGLVTIILAAMGTDTMDKFSFKKLLHSDEVPDKIKEDINTEETK